MTRGTSYSPTAHNRPPIKRYVAAGVFMTALALAGYSLADNHRDLQSSLPSVVATGASPSEAPASAMSAQPAVAGSATQPIPLSPADLGAIEAEMNAYSRQVPAIATIAIAGPQPALPAADASAIQAAVDTTLDTMMATLHTLMVQANATPVMTPVPATSAPFGN